MLYENKNIMKVHSVEVSLKQHGHEKFAQF